MPYDKVSNLTNVVHLAQLDNSNVLVMSGGSGASVNVTTIELP